MNKIFNPELYHRRSIRLKDYDYSNKGAYFVTIVCQNRENLLGDIKDDKMILNDAGKMVELWWQKIPEKFPHTEIDEYVIMPNHFHGILCIIDNVENQNNVRAVPCDRPAVNGLKFQKNGLSGIVSWLKTMSTNEYIKNVKENNWPPFNKSVWQKNYFEHVIRDENDLMKIREYIICNPVNWESDKNFVE